DVAAPAANVPTVGRRYLIIDDGGVVVCGDSPCQRLRAIRRGFDSVPDPRKNRAQDVAHAGVVVYHEYARHPVPPILRRSEAAIMRRPHGGHKRGLPGGSGRASALLTACA